MDQYIVLRKPRVSSALEHTRPLGLPKSGAELRAEALPQLEVLSLNDKELVETKRDPRVSEVSLVMPTSLIKPVSSDQPNEAADDWGLDATNAKFSNFKGENAVVAVLDTGIDRTHPAFAGMELFEADFTKPKGRREEQGAAADGYGHGTHCAGTIFGRDVPVGADPANKVRIGVAPGIRKALIGKVLDDDGFGNSAMIYDAILWANSFQNGIVDVISMSLGLDFTKMVERFENEEWPPPLAVSKSLVAFRDNLRLFDSLMASVEAKAVFDDGVIVIAAAGNQSLADGKPPYRVAASLPAAATSIISVGALAQAGPNTYAVAPFSNTFCSVSAPGVNIRSAKQGGGLKFDSGTSMACPHVAGVAALWWDRLRRESPNGKTSVNKVRNKLMGTLRTTVFMPGVEVADRGDGLVTAP